MQEWVRLVTAHDLGGAIRGARIQNGLSQQELASKTGQSRKFIVDLESGKETAELAASLRVANALDIHWAAPFPTPQLIRDEASRSIARELSSSDKVSTLGIAMDSLKQLKMMKPEHLKKSESTGANDSMPCWQRAHGLRLMAFLRVFRRILSGIGAVASIDTEFRGKTLVYGGARN
ncbi:helix-turn-helix domain-containing protein [Glutamicibacter nicotianae]|uniref:helix-turn-helix domain-containing protein n=1 Tax=Glutamicibacter nicotianae TaxID=37929 RepID=UPI00167FB8FF|nr:helix-turn-helix domain-containing protein [Glutamicibacter nicotianae]